jgi:hypothetical protein
MIVVSMKAAGKAPFREHLVTAAPMVGPAHAKGPAVSRAPTGPSVPCKRNTMILPDFLDAREAECRRHLRDCRHLLAYWKRELRTVLREKASRTAQDQPTPSGDGFPRPCLGRGSQRALHAHTARAPRL